MQPFVDYQEVHEPKGADHEDKLGNKFENQIQPVPEKVGVNTFHHNPEQHMDYADDDGELLFDH